MSGAYSTTAKHILCNNSDSGLQLFPKDLPCLLRNQQIRYVHIVQSAKFFFVSRNPFRIILSYRTQISQTSGVISNYLFPRSLSNRKPQGKWHIHLRLRWQVVLLKNRTHLQRWLYVTKWNVTQDCTSFSLLLLAGLLCTWSCVTWIPYKLAYQNLIVITGFVQSSSVKVNTKSGSSSMKVFKISQLHSFHLNPWMAFAWFMHCLHLTVIWRRKLPRLLAVIIILCSSSTL